MNPDQITVSENSLTVFHSAAYTFGDPLYTTNEAVSLGYKFSGKSALTRPVSASRRKSLSVKERSIVQELQKATKSSAPTCSTPREKKLVDSVTERRGNEAKRRRSPSKPSSASPRAQQRRKTEATATTALVPQPAPVQQIRQASSGSQQHMVVGNNAFNSQQLRPPQQNQQQVGLSSSHQRSSHQQHAQHRQQRQPQIPNQGQQQFSSQQMVQMRMLQQQQQQQQQGRSQMGSGFQMPQFFNTSPMGHQQPSTGGPHRSMPGSSLPSPMRIPGGRAMTMMPGHVPGQPMPSPRNAQPPQSSSNSNSKGNNNVQSKQPQQHQPPQQQSGSNNGGNDTSDPGLR